MTDQNPITWNATCRFYWTAVWRTVVMYIIGYAPFMVWLKVADHLGNPNVLLFIFGYSWLVVIVATFIATRMALRKRYRDFKLEMIRGSPS